MLVAPFLSIHAAALPVLAGATSGTGTFDLVFDQLQSDSLVDQYLALRALADSAPGTPFAEMVGGRIARLTAEGTKGVDPLFVRGVEGDQAELEPLLDSPQGPAAGAVAHFRQLVAPTESARRSHPYFPSELVTERGDLFTEFGKVVAQLWREDAPGARPLFREWLLDPERPGRNMEKRFLTASPGQAAAVADLFSRNGLIVRQALVPGYLFRSGEETEMVHWLVARPGASPVTRLIDSLVRAGEPPLPDSFTISGHTVTGRDDAGAAKLLQGLFGRPVTINQILRAVSIDLPHYRLDQLRIESPSADKRHEQGIVIIGGQIVTDTGEPASEFYRVIHPATEPGTLWIASGSGHNYANPERFAAHTRQGIGRQVHQRFLAFLYHLGVDALELSVTLAGAYVWPRIGFDFIDERIQQAMKVRFREYLYQHNIPLSPEKEKEWLAIQHAWELADFQLEDGRPVGKEFLLHYGETKKRDFSTRFWLRPDYPGWGRLFKRPLS